MEMGTREIYCPIATSVNLGFVYYKKVENEKSFVKLPGLVKSVTEVVTGCQRMTKVAIFAV